MADNTVDIENGQPHNGAADEVFIGGVGNIGGSSSIVVLDDVDVPAQDEQPAARKFTRAPEVERYPQRPAVGRVMETRDVLAESDVLKYVDLEELANPEKLIKKKGTVDESSGPPPDVDTSTDRPVPARLPPAPKSSKTKTSSKANAPKSVTIAAATKQEVKPAKKQQQQQQQQEQPPVARSSPKRRSQTSVQRRRFDDEYEVEGEGQYEVFEVGRADGVRPKVSRYFDDDLQPTGDLYYDNERAQYVDMPPTEPRGRRRRQDRDRRRQQQADSSDDEPGERRHTSPPAPTPRRVSPEELRARREDEENKEKAEILYRLSNYEERGYRMANTYSMASNIDELRFELNKIRNHESAKHSVKWYKVFLMIVVTTIETLNTKFDPFGLRLKKWSKRMNEKKEDLDDCFHRLHDKYSSKTSIEPEYELIFFLFGGAFMYHLENTADNHGDLGNLITAITGGSAEPAKPKKRVVVEKETLQEQPAVRTNIASFQQQQQRAAAAAAAATQSQQQQQQQESSGGEDQTQQPMYGKSGRRIMTAPMIPSGAAEMSSMFMMAGASKEDDMDVPIPTDFKLPPSVGGFKPPTTPKGGNNALPNSKKKVGSVKTPVSTKTPHSSKSGVAASPTGRSVAL